MDHKLLFQVPDEEIGRMASVIRMCMPDSTRQELSRLDDWEIVQHHALQASKAVFKAILGHREVISNPAVIWNCTNCHKIIGPVTTGTPATEECPFCNTPRSSTSDAVSVATLQPGPKTPVQPSIPKSHILPPKTVVHTSIKPPRRRAK